MGISSSAGTTKVRFNNVLPRRASKSIEAEHPQLGPVFVNQLAWQSIQAKSATFPEGSVIVREKPSKSGDTKPELLAVMIKRQKDFNSDGGDWQFLLFNGEGTKVKLNQKTGECLGCHSTQSKTDFVYPLK